MSDINTPTGWDSEKNLRIQEVTGEKKDELFETLFWNTEAVLNDLKENHVKVEENVEFMWYEWKFFHIDLPSVGDFKWSKFDFFISKDQLEIWEFESNLDLENQSYSMKDVGEFLGLLRIYMKEYWISLDPNMDFCKDLRERETYNAWCDTWECLSYIMDIKGDHHYFLKDKEWNDLRAEWIFGYDSDWNNTICCFQYKKTKYFFQKANLLLKLSN